MNFTASATEDGQCPALSYSVFAPRTAAALFQKDCGTIGDLEHQFHWAESTNSPAEEPEQETRYLELEKKRALQKASESDWSFFLSLFLPLKYFPDCGAARTLEMPGASRGDTGSPAICEVAAVPLGRGRRQRKELSDAATQSEIGE